jgi:hypothetical protein
MERFPQKEYTPLNRARVYILNEILETGLTRLPHQRGKEHGAHIIDVRATTPRDVLD